MATPRKHLIDPDVPLFYHLVSRCVQRAFLCGHDPVTGRDYSHRKQWLIDRLHALVPHFAVDLHGYCVMSNHFHLCVFHDPNVHLRWSDDEVADRWLAVSPPRTYGKPVSSDLLAEQRRALLADRTRLAHVRRELGSVSTFMKFLKQHIARQANAEDDVRGHFFEQRFWSAALLSERACLAAMLYIDLNPVRALIAKSIEDIRHAGITERLAQLEADQIALDDDLMPLASGLKPPERQVRVSLRAYVALLQVVIDAEIPPPDSMEARWQRDVASLHRKQRAYGSEQQLRAWSEARHWKRPGTPFAA
jgi:REP element-mobilizing transposase RayT